MGPKKAAAAAAPAESRASRDGEPAAIVDLSRDAGEEIAVETVGAAVQGALQYVHDQEMNGRALKFAAGLSRGSVSARARVAAAAAAAARARSLNSL